MNSFFQAIKYDYLQRVRSYRFLIIACLTTAFAYSLIPAPGSSYSTIKIGSYLGLYNSAWIAYTSAIMASVFVSLIGYYLINTSIKKDLDTGVGQIIAATGVSNKSYLLSKVLCNFIILLSLLGLILLVSIGLFFLYNDGFPFEISHSIIAYLLIPIPSFFLVSCIAVILEMYLTRRGVLQNILFFALFSVMLGLNANDDNISSSLDFFGSQRPTSQMVDMVNKMDVSGDSHGLNIGFMFSKNMPQDRFEFTGVDLDFSFILLRGSLFIIGLAAIILVAPTFHRFTFLDSPKKNKKKNQSIQQIASSSNGLSIKDMPIAEPLRSILPLIKIELMMMIKEGSKWLWFLTLGAAIALTFTPIEVAHRFVLPILWFLQVGRIAPLITKEKAYNIHYFSFSSYRPLSRLLASQLISGFILMSVLTLPLIIRLLIANPIAIAGVLLGGLTLVLCSAFSGILTQGKRLFEIVFFLLTYANLNGIPFLDYFGGYHQNTDYFVLFTGICLVLLIGIFFLRKQELQRV